MPLILGGEQYGKGWCVETAGTGPELVKEFPPSIQYFVVWWKSVHYCGKFS